MTVLHEKIDIVGEKVRLRSARVADVRGLYPLVKNDAVIANLAWDGPENEESLRADYEKCVEGFASGGDCRLTIERADRPDVIGSLSVRSHRSPQLLDLGYWLGEPYWGQGYMTEAVRLASHLAFAYFDAVRLEAWVFVGNTGSRRVLEKNGFTLDGTLRCQIEKRGRWLDEWFFTLLHDEWESDRERYRPEYENVVLDPAVDEPERM